MKQQRIISPKALAHLGQIKTSSKTKANTQLCPQSKEKSSKFSNIVQKPCKKSIYSTSITQSNSPSKYFDQTQTQGITRNSSLTQNLIRNNQGVIIKASDIVRMYSKYEQNKTNLLTSGNSTTKNFEKNDSKIIIEGYTKNDVAEICNCLKGDDDKKTNRNSAEISKINCVSPKSKNKSLYRKSGNISKNISNLSKNYKIEQTPSRILHKEKQIHEFCNIDKDTVDDTQTHLYSDHKIISNSKCQCHSYQNSLSCQPNSLKLANPSNPSLMPDSQINILHGLTQSVQELNQRLIKSEEITYERLRENKLLKIQIENLEKKLDETDTRKTLDTGSGPLCNQNCIFF
ncbi:hypothetical protein SteCoe_15789 [Stentor coeruleus]|uniref:Uncharacterized protein n=1 Tax=Stentor coeruleus TaxID=5963 RepID=A0A1R2C2U8_9CILI|nr:hypothetical protein SteCoe_15789 [Stentor coeruleus]